MDNNLERHIYIQGTDAPYIFSGATVAGMTLDQILEVIRNLDPSIPAHSQSPFQLLTAEDGTQYYKAVVIPEAQTKG